MHKKFTISSLTSKIISIFASLAIVTTGVIMPITAANAAEGANDAVGVDTAAVLNGTDAGLKANDSQMIPATGDFTVEAWVQNARAAGTTGHFNIIAQTNDGGANIGPDQFVLQTLDNQIRVYVGNQYLDTGVILTQNVWYHIAVTVVRSGTNLVLSIYVNGAAAAIKTFAVSATGLSTYTPGNDFWVGSNPVQPTSEFWSGKIDQVKVWGDDLAESQVAESMHVYAATGVTSAPTLAAHFDFNENDSTDGKIYNRADAAKDLTITTPARLAWADIAEVVSGGNIDAYRNIVYKFPRTYLNALGGWTTPSNLTSAEVLTVGGGGGGGENVGNGGSGGSIAYHSGFAIASGSKLAVKVGQGGRPGVLVDDTMYGTSSATWQQDSTGSSNTSVISTQRDGGSGQSTILSVGSQTLTAPGGNGGMTYWDNNRCDGGAGATHAAANTAGGSVGAGGTISAPGSAGGQGFLNAATGTGTSGWNDTANVISGAAYRFGAGGAGADGRSAPTSVAGGTNGGGSTAASANINAVGGAVRGGDGAANSGGGGAGGNTGCTPGGAGGAGVVYVRSSAVSISDVTAPGSAVRNLSAVISGPAGTYVATILSEKGTITAGALNGATNTTAANVPSGWSGYLALRGTPDQLSAAIKASTLTLPSTTGTSTLKIELNPVVTPPSGTFLNTANGHYYKLVSPGSAVNFASAASDANASGNNYLGLNGYLINITSAAEQSFQNTNIPNASHPNIWIGGREQAGAGNNGKWIWFDGPEAGTQFLTGNVGGSPAKAAVVGQYNNFNSSEPNNNSASTAGDDCAVGNFSSSDQWDDVTCVSTMAKYVVEYGGRGTDPGVDAATVTATLQAVNVNFTELNFDYTSGKYTNLKKLNVSTDATRAGTTISATDSTGKNIGDRVLFKAVTIRGGITVDAIVTTITVKDATVKNYESGTGAGGAATNFQADVDIAAANGFAEFQFEFYQTDASIVANCNASITCAGSTKVILENVNISIIDIDYFQWNEVNDVESYTVSDPTNIKECVQSSWTSPAVTCTARVAQAGLSYPANLRFQGPDGIDSTLPQDMAIMNFGQVETFKIKFGRSKSGSPNYYGIAFKAQPWGQATPATNGPAAQTYSIVYDGNGKTSGSVPASHTGVVGSNFTTSGNTGTLVKTGYTFNGWNTAANGTGTAYTASSALLMPKDGMTLYAQWIASQFTLTYNPNGGSAAPGSELRSAGATANLSSTEPTRSGFIFAGWAPNADGSGGTTSAGASYTMPGSNTTLYAKWTAATGTIAYNGNGSSSGSTPSSSTGTSGAAYTVIGNTGSLARTGFTFAGWNTAANGSGTDYAAGNSTSYPASGTTVTLYAQWTAIVYSLSYNANGGNNAAAGAAPTQTGVSGATLTLASTTYDPVRTGYTFDGWYTTASGTGGTLYAPGLTTFSMPAANTVLYAKWTAVLYNVNYDKNSSSATGTLTDTTYANNATVTVKHISAGSITSATLRFVGWNTAADGTGSDYISGSTFRMGTANVTLYAKWVAANIVLTFDANGGTNAPPADTHAANTSITLPSQTPNRPGYVFLGWTEAANGSGTVYDPSGTYSTPLVNGVLYAKWQAINYTFFYNVNGGTAGAGAPTSVTGLNVGGLVTVYVVDGSNPAPTRAGYSFTGWNAATDGSSTNYAGGTTYTMGASNYTIYAQWLGDPFTLTYNSNGGNAVSPTSEVRRAGAVANITATVPTRTGYTFSSWNTASNGTGTIYAASASLTMPAANLTLYAQWTAVNNGVSYNANGGTGAPNGANYTFGSSVTVSNGVPTRTGYTFIGWNTIQGGGGTPYSGGDIFNMPSTSVVLYAQWAATAYVFDYDANGGVNAPAATNQNYGEVVTVTTSRPTRSGYDFQGWNTQAAGAGTTRAGNSTFTMPANNVTLYAQWSLATFTVYYNANGGSGSIAPQPGRFGSTVTLSQTTPTRAGYRFDGWDTAPDGSGVDYSSGGTLTMPGNNVTLYAKWVALTYTLTYSANGGTNAPAAEANKTTGENFALATSAQVPTRTGYWFSGWNTVADGSGTNYASSANFVMGSSNATLYAKWVENTYTVSYNANGGSGAPASQATSSTVTVEPSTSYIQRSGYTFSHWYTTPSGTGGSQYAPGSTLTPSGNVVLYAIWTAKTIRVTYDINGGANPLTDTPPYQEATYDGQPIQLAGSTGFAKANSQFLTWNTVADGSGTSYAAEDPNFRVPSSNVTLYAIWSAAYYAVEYKPNGGTGAPNDQFAAPGQTVNVAPAEPTKSGYEFVAWSDVSNGNTYSANAPITMPSSNVTLIANWTVRSASVPGGSSESKPGTPITGITYPKKLNLTVYFKGDRSYLIPATVTKLKKLAATAKLYGYATNITIYGRVKETNDKSYDAKLSKARAINVAKYLKKLGVQGAFKIIPAGISPENKAISRRVDMSLFWNKR